MAMPFIIHHNENIYNLDEKEKAKLKKPPRYAKLNTSSILKRSLMLIFLHTNNTDTIRNFALKFVRK